MRPVVVKLAILSISSCLATLTMIDPVQADVIPYASAGTVNSASYVFTASSSADVIAYFAGSGASYDNRLGLLVNGVSTGNVGLDNHTSAVGQSFDLGFANAGDVLTFVLQNLTLGKTAYSDPSLNNTYDDVGYLGSHQHVYSTAYTSTSPIIDSIPAGVYVGFEDLPFPSSDFNYADETFVFKNVNNSAVPPSPTSTPEPASLVILAAGLVGLLGLGRARS